MIDLEKLKAEERKAHKYDYADRFYRDNWDSLVAEIERLRVNLRYAKLGDGDNYDPAITPDL